MKVLICCEGAHEKSGALQTLIEKVLGRAIDADYDPPTRLLQQAGKGGKLFKKALGYALAAERRGCDGVVFLVDHDDGPDGKDRVEQLVRAQDYLSLAVAVKRAFGVPVVTFDAWMVADEVAMSKALGTTVDRSPDPEDIADAKSSLGESLVNAWRYVTSTAKSPRTPIPKFCKTVAPKDSAPSPNDCEVGRRNWQSLCCSGPVPQRS